MLQYFQKTVTPSHLTQARGICSLITMCKSFLICRMTKAAAFMEERDYVIPEDVKKVFTDVTAHRMILDSRARYQEQSAKDILEEILKDTSAPKVEGE